MLPHQLHQSILQIRQLLKSYNILIYTGSQLDDLTLMELELDDLHDEKYIETPDYLHMKMTLRQAAHELTPPPQK